RVAEVGGSDDDTSSRGKGRREDLKAMDRDLLLQELPPRSVGQTNEVRVIAADVTNRFASDSVNLSFGSHGAEDVANIVSDIALHALAEIERKVADPLTNAVIEPPGKPREDSVGYLHCDEVAAGVPVWGGERP